MNALEIAQIANIGLSTFAALKSKKESSAPTRDQIKAYILASTTALQALGKLEITDIKQWNKDIDDQVKLVERFMKHSKWSD